MEARNPVPVTPNRKTHLFLDCVEDFQIQQPFFMKRRLTELCRTDTGQRENVAFVAGAGWRLKSKLSSLFSVSEHSDAQSLIKRVGDPTGITVASTLKEVTVNRQASELNLDPSAVSAGAIDTGDTMVEKLITQGQTWNEGVLSTDQTAFSGPGDDGIVVLDRVAVGNSVHHPNEEVMFRLNFFDSQPSYSEAIARFYFCGPAGMGPGPFSGMGQYALTIMGTGSAVLWERGLTDGVTIWKKRHEFSFADKSHPVGKSITIVVIPSTSDRNGGLARIAFSHGATTDPQAESSGRARGATADMNNRAQADGHQEVYAVPFAGTGTFLQSVRLDLRRDLRARFQICDGGYATSGKLTDDNFSMPFYPGTSEELLLGYDADVPVGCTLVPKLYEASTNTPLTMTYIDTIDKAATFQLPSDPTKNSYYAVFEFTGNGNATPTLQGMDVTRRSVYATVDNIEKEVRAPVKWQIWGQDVDPAHERAEIELKDVTNSAEVLDVRSGMPIRLETEYDEDSSKRCVLFRGYVDRCISTRRGTLNQRNEPTVFPAVDWKERNISAVGAWQRLYQSFLSMMVNYSSPRGGEPLDTTTGQPLPWKATDAIQNILAIAGFPRTMIGIGAGGAAPATDLDVRCFSAKGDFMDLQADPTTRAGELAEKIAQQYLGATLYFDMNAGEQGVWKLILPRRAPYTNVAAYVTDGPGAGKVPHALISYADTTIGEATVPTGYIRKGTARTWVEPPEVNMLTVSGTGVLTSLASEKNLTCTVFNEKSFNFLPGQATADPSHPDYLGRLVWGLIVSWSLNTPEAVQWAARRAFESAGYSHKMASFQAPLLLFDNEGEEGRKRYHRPYDPILVDGQQFLVRSCNPCSSSDDQHWVMIEAEAPRF